MNRLFAAFLVLAPIAVACSDDVPATARAFATMQIGPGNETGVNDSAKCGFATEQLFVLGREDAAISSGDEQNGLATAVECTVRPDGDGFYVQAYASLQGKGSVTMSGRMTKEGQQMGLRSTFASDDIGGFNASDCVFDFSPMAKAPENPPIERGRIWGTLTCQHLERPDQGRMCKGVATLKLENCGQQ